MDGVCASLGNNYSKHSMAVATLMFFIAGLAEGLMDWLQFRMNPSHDTWGSMFWNAQYSWRNKWKNGDPRQGEKFFLSSTLFVFMTDGWHMMKFVRNLFIFTGLLVAAVCEASILSCVITVVLSRLTYGLGFAVTFNWVHKL